MQRGAQVHERGVVVGARGGVGTEVVDEPEQGVDVGADGGVVVRVARDERRAQRGGRPAAQGRDVDPRGAAVAGPAAARRADDDGRLGDVRDGGDVDPAQRVEHEAGGERADLVERLVDRREPGRLEARGLDVVEADDGEVARHVEAVLADASHEAERVAVGRDHDRRRPVGGRQERVGGGAAAPVRVVGRDEQVVRLCGQAVRLERGHVGLVPVADVALPEVADEPDAAVAVRDEVLDGRPRAARVVGDGDRGDEAREPAARDDDRPAGRLDAREVARGCRRRDGDDAVDLVPRDARVEVGGFTDLVAVHARLERLHHDGPAARGGELARDTREQRTEVVPARARREHEERRRVRHCWPPGRGPDVPASHPRSVAARRA